MQPIDFKERNEVLKPPAGMDNCIPLPVYRNGEYCMSVWEPSDAEISEFNRTGKFRIYLAVFFGDTQPPVWLSAIKPDMPNLPGEPSNGPDEE